MCKGSARRDHRVGLSNYYVSKNSSTVYELFTNYNVSVFIIHRPPIKDVSIQWRD